MPLGCGLEAILLHASIERAATEAERFSSLAYISLESRQRLSYEQGFDRLQTEVVEILRLRALQIEAEIRRSLFPTLWCCRAAVPVMVAGGGGTVVNVSSVATRGVNRVPYAAAKGGVNAITACLAMEYADHGIRVCGVAPGGTEAPPRRIPRNAEPATEQETRWYQQVVDQTVSSSLMKRYGTTEEQAAAILFLASDEASYITGVTLPVAGGDLG